MMTISIHGGGLILGGTAGIACRHMDVAPTVSGGDVASSNMQKYRIIRIITMSTKTI